jgi:hypothetical protein
VLGADLADAAVAAVSCGDQQDVGKVEVFHVEQAIGFLARG